MGKNKLKIYTLSMVVFSIILSFIIAGYKLEQVASIGVTIFCITAILISSSLMQAAMSTVTKKISALPLALLLGGISCVFYFMIFSFTFSNLGGGESGMIFGGVFGVLGSLAVGLISIIINLGILCSSDLTDRAA